MLGHGSGGGVDLFVCRPMAEGWVHHGLHIIFKVYVEENSRMSPGKLYIWHQILQFVFAFFKVCIGRRLHLTGLDAISLDSDMHSDIGF